MTSDGQSQDQKYEFLLVRPSRHLRRNIEVQCGSADRNFQCHPGLVPATLDTMDDEMAYLNIPVFVKRRSNPIVLIRLPRTIREDHAQAFDYRESGDLIDDPPQMHVRDDDKAYVASAVHLGANGSSLFPSLTMCTS